MKARLSPSLLPQRRHARFEIEFGDFRCTVCRHTVSVQPALSGVHNRNHCPYCLWSRHVDLAQAGDRLSACKGGMRPIGLTLKREHKKYVSATSGELMLIHQCTECGKLSINRIAADDHTPTLMEVFQRSLELAPQVREQLSVASIAILGAADRSIVRARLFGVN